MPRPKAILQSEFPYHVSARCINKEWFNIPMLDVWNIMSRQLSYVSWAYRAKIHSFVLMSNHFHMLISTPDSNLDLIMGNFMKECSRYMNESTLKWLNKKPDNKNWKKVEMAMSKSVFKFPLSERTKSPSHLEYDLI